MLGSRGGDALMEKSAFLGLAGDEDDSYCDFLLRYLLRGTLFDTLSLLRSPYAIIEPVGLLFKELLINGA